MSCSKEPDKSVREPIGLEVVSQSPITVKTDESSSPDASYTPRSRRDDKSEVDTEDASLD